MLRLAALPIALLAMLACSRPAPEAESATPSAAGAAAATPVDDPMAVTVYKSPSCGCCGNWVDYMREAGFRVAVVDQDDLTDVKKRLGVSGDLQSCHTATVGGYVLEGHVPVADVRRLLAERPDVVGLAVPGMPMGSPGMEGLRKDPYDVVSFDRAGKREVFASH
jgi:hypothetical protein